MSTTYPFYRRLTLFFVLLSLGLLLMLVGAASVLVLSGYADRSDETHRGVIMVPKLPKAKVSDTQKMLFTPPLWMLPPEAQAAYINAVDQRDWIRWCKRHSAYELRADVYAMSDEQYREYLEDYGRAKEEAGVGHLW